MSGIPDPRGAGVSAVLAARLPGAGAGLYAGYRQRHLLGSRESAVLDAADEAIDDDWAREYWWLDKPAGESS